jgi:hypothetical protein
MQYLCQKSGEQQPEAIGYSDTTSKTYSLRRLSPMPDIMLILTCLSQSVDWL